MRVRRTSRRSHCPYIIEPQRNLVRNQSSQKASPNGNSKKPVRRRYGVYLMMNYWGASAIGCLNSRPSIIPLSPILASSEEKLRLARASSTNHWSSLHKNWIEKSAIWKRCSCRLRAIRPFWPMKKTSSVIKYITSVTRNATLMLDWRHWSKERKQLRPGKLHSMPVRRD